jgi:hypothetical protein
LSFPVIQVAARIKAIDFAASHNFSDGCRWLKWFFGRLEDDLGVVLGALKWLPRILVEDGSDGDRV